MSLNQSKVVFNEVEHTYLLGDKKLSGVTSILSRYLFKDKYKDVPKAVLEKSAENGTLIHSQMQMWINGMPFAEQLEEVVKMQEIVSGINFVESEFTVSDNETVASQIDAVQLLEDGTYVLWDWKSTSKLDMNYLSWQLSIYAYLFEMQTGMVVSSLKAGHIRPACSEERNVERIDNTHIIALLSAAKENLESFDNPIVPCVTDEQQGMMAELYAVEKTIIDIEDSIKKAKEQQTLLRDALLKSMEASGLTKIENDNIRISYIAPTKKDGFDVKKFKEEHGDMYDQYYKPTNVKASVRITIKQN